MHNADVAVESANRNTTFDSGIGVDWSKMNNVGSLCEHVTGSWGSVDGSDDVKVSALALSGNILVNVRQMGYAN